MSKTSRDVVYVIGLRGDKYYVGRTKNLKARLQAHASGEGTVWTTMHKPIKPIRALLVHETESDFDEDMVTKMFMREFGVDNVRGGTYSTPVLSPEQISFLEKELTHASGACFRCKRTSHMASACYAKTDVNGNPLPTGNGSDEDDEDDEDEDTCARCNRTGHMARQCYARTHVTGRLLTSNNSSKKWQ